MWWEKGGMGPSGADPAQTSGFGNATTELDELIQILLVTMICAIVNQE